jgi:hypothetical protein
VQTSVLKPALARPFIKWDLHEVKSAQTSALKTALARPFIK